jgi:hypothetical protein
MKKKENIGYAFGPLNGLGIKKGRLVNNAPQAVSGIAKMAELRKEMKKSQKISIVREGTYQAEMMSDLNEKLSGLED